MLASSFAPMRLLCRCPWPCPLRLRWPPRLAAHPRLQPLCVGVWRCPPRLCTAPARPCLPSPRTMDHSGAGAPAPPPVSSPITRHRRHLRRPRPPYGGSTALPLSAAVSPLRSPAGRLRASTPTPPRPPSSGLPRLHLTTRLGLWLRTRPPPARLRPRPPAPRPPGRQPAPAASRGCSVPALGARATCPSADSTSARICRTLSCLPRLLFATPSQPGRRLPSAGLARWLPPPGRLPAVALARLPRRLASLAV